MDEGQLVILKRKVADGKRAVDFCVNDALDAFCFAIRFGMLGTEFGEPVVYSPNPEVRVRPSRRTIEVASSGSAPTSWMRA